MPRFISLTDEKPSAAGIASLALFGLGVVAMATYTPPAEDITRNEQNAVTILCGVMTVLYTVPLLRAGFRRLRHKG